MDTRRVMIYGAGQAGEMALTWLPAGCAAEAFIDADKSRQGTILCGVPVISPKEAFSDPGKHPDAVYLCVINREARDEIRKKIEEYGYRGEITDVPALRTTADIRLSFLRLYAKEIRTRGIEGDIAELGVYKGETAKELNALFPDRDLLLFDTFEGFSEKDLISEREKAKGGRNAKAAAGEFGDTSPEIVRSKLPYPEKAIFFKGYFPDTLDEYEEYRPKERRYALVSLDADLYEPTYEGLKYFCPLMSPGGVIVVHDYNSSRYPGVKRAVNEFSEKVRKVYPMPLMDLHGTAVILCGDS